MLPSRRPSRGGAFLLATALVVASACSGDNGLPTAFEEIEPAEDVTAVEPTSAERWGTGYAIAAHPIDGDRTAVVTTAGVYVTDGTALAPIEIEAFGGPTQVQTSGVSPDGSVLVIATNAPASLRWYDLVEGQPTAAVDVGVGNAVREFAFVESTNRLVAVTSGGLVSWDVAAPTAPATQLAEGQFGPAAELAEQVVAPAANTGDLVLTDGVTVDRRSIELPEGATLWRTTASPDGTTLGVTSGVGPNELERTDTVHVIDADTMGEAVAIGFDQAIRAGQFAVADSVVAVADEAELTISSRSGDTITTATPLPGDPIQSVVATDAGISTVHRSGSVVAWRGDAWEPEVLGQADVTIRFAAADGADLTSVDIDGGITAWGIDDGSRTDDPQFATGVATSSAISADSGQVAVATAAGVTVVLDDRMAEQTRYVVEGRSPHIDTVEFNPESAQVATGLAERLGELSFDDSVSLWDEETGRPAVTIGGEAEDVAGCSSFVNRIGFTDNGQLLSTVSHDFTVGIHDGATGDYIVTLEPFASTVLDTGFSPSSELFVASSDDSSVKVWETEDFELLTTYVSTPGGLQAFDLMPDEETMVASDLSGRLLLMDVLTGEIIRVIAELGTRSSAISVSADGGIVAAPFRDGTIGIWSTTTGAQLTTLIGHSDSVTDVDFALGGDWLVSSSADGTIRKWDLDVVTT